MMTLTILKLKFLASMFFQKSRFRQQIGNIQDEGLHKLDTGTPHHPRKKNKKHYTISQNPDKSVPKVKEITSRKVQKRFISYHERT
jgi:hypothetical protein